MWQLSDTLTRKPPLIRRVLLFSRVRLWRLIMHFHTMQAVLVCKSRPNNDISLKQMCAIDNIFLDTMLHDTTGFRLTLKDNTKVPHCTPRTHRSFAAAVNLVFLQIARGEGCVGLPSQAADGGLLHGREAGRARHVARARQHPFAYHHK